jgi:glycyl-tRNA synthetase
MFETALGASAETAQRLFLRPETAQGIFVNFLNVLGSVRVRPPFGIAQIGKSFRNEITTKNFIFRTSEFEQMELEFFCHPQEAVYWYLYWREERLRWYRTLGIDPVRLRLRDHEADELSHYSSATADIEYQFPWGWAELEGVANRGDYDLSAHSLASGQNLRYRDPNSQDELTCEGYVPYVIEPSAGADRAVLAFLVDAYDEDELGGERRVVLRLHPRLAPVKVAVLPLLRKDGQPEFAHRLYEELRLCLEDVELDVNAHIGRRYRRQDEIGTPWCVTVDHQTLEDGTVTVRERDTLVQTRLPAPSLAENLSARLQRS